MTGRFEMGSTIILIFEADFDTYFAIQPDMDVKMGEKIAGKVE